MYIRNRTPDVVSLRCHICQDFLEMIVVDNWRTLLYTFIQGAINETHKDNYIEQYKRMREKGIDNYSVYDMDAPFIVTILRFCPSLATITKPTSIALYEIKEDRHATNHSSENETDEELYLRALVSLKDMQNFLHTVDIYEIGIPDEKRAAFVEDYSKKINNLKLQIYSDCIELFQIKKDIQTILSNDDPNGTFIKLYETYNKRFLASRSDDSRQQQSEFIIEASNVGILSAHTFASIEFEFLHDYDEATRRLELMVTGCEKLSSADAKHIINFVNDKYIRGIKPTNRMLQLVQTVKSQGFDISETDNSITWNKKKK